MIIVLNIRRPRWPGKTRTMVMKLEFEPFVENGYHLESLKEGKMFWVKIMLN